MSNSVFTPSHSQVDPATFTQTDEGIVQEYQVGKFLIKVIRNKCISAASCVALAPHTFDLDEEQLAVILNSEEYDGADEILLAAQSCPTAAIEIYDVSTNPTQKVWPR